MPIRLHGRLRLATTAAWLALALVPSLASGQTALLVQWNASGDPSVAGYQVSYGTQPGVYANTLDVGGATSCLVPGLTLGRWYYFAVRAYNVTGTPGPYSNEVSGFTTSVVSLTADHSFPLTIGVPVVWTAAIPTNSPAVEYAFWMWGGQNAGWSPARAYDASPSFTWTPPGPAGAMPVVAVWARQVGAHSWVEAGAVDNPYALSAAAAGYGVSAVVESGVSPFPTGASITWTAVVDPAAATDALELQLPVLVG